MAVRALFLDVGQGHGVVVEDGGNSAVVDCPAGGVETVLSALRDAETVDIFVTHRDLDHCGGIPAIIESTRLRRLLMNLSYALPPETRSYTRVKTVLSAIFDRCHEAGVEIETASYRGQSGQLGAAVSWTILWPTSAVGAHASLRNLTNHASLVVRFETESSRVLVTGDIDAAAIQSLVTDREDLKADALQIPHHGASCEAMIDLMEAVQPSVVNVSFGRSNQYGHPAAEVLHVVAERSNVYCNQVARHCDGSNGLSQSCAGSIAVELGGGLAVTTETTNHSDRVQRLESPVCLNSQLPTSSN